MFSRLLRQSYRQKPVLLLAVRGPQKVNVRKILGLVPPSQYDVPIPKRLRLLYVMKEYWETIPLFVSTFIAFGVVAVAILWACQNKVDIVFSSRSRGNISRVMDLRNPSVHKMKIINQRYEPWPEMADALEKVAAAEKRALSRLESCNQA